MKINLKKMISLGLTAVLTFSSLPVFALNTINDPDVVQTPPEFIKLYNKYWAELDSNENKNDDEQNIIIGNVGLIMLQEESKAEFKLVFKNMIKSDLDIISQASFGIGFSEARSMEQDNLKDLLVEKAISAGMTPEEADNFAIGVGVLLVTVKDNQNEIISIVNREIDLINQETIFDDLKNKSADEFYEKYYVMYEGVVDETVDLIIAQMPLAMEPMIKTVVESEIESGKQTIFDNVAEQTTAVNDAIDAFNVKHVGSDIPKAVPSSEEKSIELVTDYYKEAIIEMLNGREMTNVEIPSLVDVEDAKRELEKLILAYPDAQTVLDVFNNIKAATDAEIKTKLELMTDKIDSAIAEATKIINEEKEILFDQEYFEAVFEKTNKILNNKIGSITLNVSTGALTKGSLLLPATATKEVIKEFIVEVHEITKKHHNRVPDLSTTKLNEFVDMGYAGLVDGIDAISTVVKANSKLTGPFFKVLYTMDVLNVTKYIAPDGNTSGGGSGTIVEATPVDLPSEEVVIIEEEDTALGGSIKYGKSYVSGYPDGTFKPSKSVTRVEIAVILAKLLELEGLSDGVRFSDVTNDFWGYEEINALADINLIQGYDNGKFLPDKPMTRAEVSSIIVKYAKIKKIKVKRIEHEFTDLDNHWAEDDANMLYSAGIITGYSDNSFRPNAHISRAETVVIFNRLLGRKALSRAEESFDDLPKEHWAYKEIETAAHESITEKSN